MLNRKDSNEADPETQTLIIENVPSETIYLLKKLFEVAHITPRGDALYDDFSDEEWNEKVTERVSKMIHDEYKRVMGDLSYKHKTHGYQLNQKLLRQAAAKQNEDSTHGFDMPDP